MEHPAGSDVESHWPTGAVRVGGESVVVGRTLHRASFNVPPAFLRAAKSAIRMPRYWTALARARAGYARHGSSYRHPYLFVAGLPKSGTSWVESMLASYAGYTLLAHPELTAFDYANRGTHGFEMPEDFFTRLGPALCVVKIHCHGSENNARVLARSAVPYCILYRDLRDAAVSHVCYVQRTPWHPEYPVYRALSVKEGLGYFARTLLPEWRDWIDSWKRWRDPAAGMEVTYERLLSDPHGAMAELVRHFALSDAPLGGIVAMSAFEKVKTGGSFFRKGVAGDWKNHFDAGLKAEFERVIGRHLVAWGYERDLDW
jgi:hypothetical protein